MLADRFLFTLQDGFVLTTAIISAVLLTIGIRVVKMLTDRFLFTLQDSFVLTTAIISAMLLTIGIRVVKRHDEENQN